MWHHTALKTHCDLHVALHRLSGSGLSSQKGSEAQPRLLLAKCKKSATFVQHSFFVQGLES